MRAIERNRLPLTVLIAVIFLVINKIDRSLAQDGVRPGKSGFYSNVDSRAAESQPDAAKSNLRASNGPVEPAAGPAELAAASPAPADVNPLNKKICDNVELDRCNRDTHEHSKRWFTTPEYMREKCQGSGPESVTLKMFLDCVESALKGCGEEKEFLAAYSPMKDFDKTVCHDDALLVEYNATWPKIRTILEGANKCEQKTYDQAQKAENKEVFCSVLEAMSVCIKGSFEELNYAFTPKLINSYLLFRWAQYHMFLRTRFKSWSMDQSCLTAHITGGSGKGQPGEGASHMNSQPPSIYLKRPKLLTVIGAIIIAIFFL